MKITILDRNAMGADLDFTSFDKLAAVEIYDSSTAEQAMQRITESDVILTNKVKITAELMGKGLVYEMV